MSAFECWPGGQRGRERWDSFSTAVVIILIVAACSLGVAPQRARAAQASAPVPATASPVATVEPSTSGALVFLGNKNIAPVVYLDGAEPAGLAVDMVRALATHMSRPVEITAMDWKLAQSLVASGQADALIQINATAQRRKIYDFSEPFLESHFAIFVHANRPGISGIPSLRGLRVGVESGGLPHQLLEKDPRIPLTVIGSFPEGFRMLSVGALDAVVVDYRVGSYVLATSGIKDVKAAGDPIASSYSAIAVRKGDAALLNDINSALKAIREDGTYDRIIANWRPTEGVFETQEQITERVYRWTSAILLVLLLIALTWAETIRRQMKRRRTAEEALRESEEMYRSLVSGMAEGVVVQGADGRVTAVNRAAERIAGRRAQQILGRTPDDPQWGAIHEDGTPFPGEDQPSMVTLRTGEPQENVVMGIHQPDGALIWISTNSQPLVSEGDTGPHAVVTTFRDITERRNAEEALRASREKLALHLKQTLLGVIEWDTEFRVREWNPAAEAIFGYSREEAIGQHAADIILPESTRSEVDSVWQELLHQKGGEFHTNQNITKDGRMILCEWINTALTDDSGAVVGVMGLARDITEQRQAEQLRAAKEAAEAASVAKSAFLASMSHEIRTPMNAILGFSQLMRHDKGLSESQRQQLDIINRSGEHLLALINDVLEMSRVEAGRISVNPTPFNLRQLLDEMGSLLGMRAEAKGLTLRVVRSEDVPRFVVTDENKLRQILVNLLGNAVKFTDQGSIELRAAVRRDEAELRLMVEIEDTGRGIAPEDGDRLFEYFEQAATGREAESGTGLGLAICREFVRLLGGEISVDSQVGVGSTFKFDIVIEEAEGEASEDSLQTRHVVGLSPGEPRYRILVADDAPDNRELLVQLLEPVGFNVRSVSDGKQALEVYEDWRPQLILMDMRMPVMDGYEVTRRIRSAPGGDDVSIVGVTASAFAEMRQGVFDAGVDEFIVKPFRESELFGKIGALLDVHYIYEDEVEESESGVAEAWAPAILSALPSGLVGRLHRAALEADFDEVLALADEVARYDACAANALRVLAERFDAEPILAALPSGEDS